MVLLSSLLVLLSCLVVLLSCLVVLLSWLLVLLSCLGVLLLVRSRGEQQMETLIKMRIQTTKFDEASSLVLRNASCKALCATKL